jgi:hypothetical protein
LKPEPLESPTEFGLAFGGRESPTEFGLAFGGRDSPTEFGLAFQPTIAQPNSVRFLLEVECAASLVR